MEVKKLGEDTLEAAWVFLRIFGRMNEDNSKQFSGFSFDELSRFLQVYCFEAKKIKSKLPEVKQA